jgi:hypothetical protein
MRHTQVAELVDQQVVDAPDGHLDRVHVHQNPALRRTAAPALAESSYQQRWKSLQPKARRSPNKIGETTIEHGSRVFEIPSLHQATDQLMITDVRYGDAEVSAALAGQWAAHRVPFSDGTADPGNDVFRR